MMKRPLFAALLVCCLTSSAMAMDKSTYYVHDGVGDAAKVVYEYKPDSLFQVKAQMGCISDIELKAGEKINYIGAGDTKRWLIDRATVGGTEHIYIKPLAPGIETNMIINTDVRSYRFYLVSVAENYVPIVQFDFPDESFQKALAAPLPWKNKEEKLYFDIYTEKKGNSYVPKKINSRYKVKKHGKLDTSVLPLEIFDDDTRTYIHMPDSNKYDQRVLYNVQDGKLTLVNYRVRGNYIIADRVFNNARLYYTSKTYVDITPSEQEYKGGGLK